MDGEPVNACMFLAVQAHGSTASETLEQFGQHPEQGWKKTEGYDPIQKAFIVKRLDSMRILHAGYDPCNQGFIASESRSKRSRR